MLRTCELTVTSVRGSVLGSVTRPASRLPRSFEIVTKVIDGVDLLRLDGGVINREKNPTQAISKKLQRQFRDDEEFFCDINGPGKRSDTVPESVHRLRPGDIDIIGAIGDSLTAGNGAMATNLLHIVMENKGVVTPIGGQGTWRQYLTIPNILKLYNPKLYGYSLSDSVSMQPESRFNVAEMGAMSRDTAHQARNLIKRMQSNSNVDMEKHWKIVFFLIGANDFCMDMCFVKNPSGIVEMHDRELTETLRILRDNLPRTMVNVIASPSMKVLMRFRGKSPECETAHRLECPCLYSLQRQRFLKSYLKIMDAWKRRQKEVINREEFHNKTDFTVNLQPFTDKLWIPSDKDNNTDFSYMSTDCFHFSQKGYARATNALWNNLLEPFSNKTQFWKTEFEDFKCPTEERPFIATKMNS
ncbi:phospholipase B1, membrane-associated-like [Phlebotomus argentipes]|uniref:phospholipase B1, membrane-associated-like n=1 Tax=Phlebotomus argentipes TaxID=94469 RepID=UPI002893710B|nr:phospholipase B1, membrane-associated-like [Phlebotomus argentipes]